jgi:ADP-ribosylglycohydrolase
MERSDLLSKFKGTVIGAAIGDAIGKAVEDIPAKEVYKFYGNIINDFVKSHPSSPSDFLKPHQVSAETIIMKILLESIVKTKMIDVYDFAMRLVEWFKKEKVHRYVDPNILLIVQGWEMGIPTSEVNLRTSSIDNVLHTIVVGLFHYNYPTLAGEGAKLVALVTGKGEDLEDSAQIIGCGTALLVNGEADLSSLEGKLQFIEDITEYVSLSEKAISYLQKVKENLKKDISLKEAINIFGNGSYVWEALPLALYLFLKDAHYPQKAFLNAVNSYGDFGGDTDAIAFLVGGWVGAYWGIEVFPEHWVKDVEFSEELLKLSEELYKIVVENNHGEENKTL